MNTKSSFLRIAILGATLAVAGAGCADLKVTKVTPENDAKVEGVRIYLPKPYLVGTPQADGTVNFDIVYLPDKSQEYAVQPETTLSAYTFQISRDEKGFLNQVEFKADTSLVGQQLLNSAGAAAAQQYNMDAAQMAAVQTQVNAAQANLDTANQSVKAAAAALAADEANQGTNYSAIVADQNALAQAQAKLPIAEAALLRAQQLGQAVATSVTAATPGTQSGPTIASNFGQPTWNQPYTASLPTRFAPMLYAIDDSVKGGAETVTLKAVTSNLRDTTVLDTKKKLDNSELEYGVNPQAQRTFATITTKPTLSPSMQTVSPDPGYVTFQFSQPIAQKPTITISSDTVPPAKVDEKTYDIEDLKENNTVLKLAFKRKPMPGDYLVFVQYGFHSITGSTDPNIVDPEQTSKSVYFTVQKSGVPILSPGTQSVDAKGGSVSFAFNKPISKLGDVKLTLDKDPSKPQDVTPTMAANNSVLTLTIKNPTAGDYTAVVNFSYAPANGGTDATAQQTIKFTLK